MKCFRMKWAEFTREYKIKFSILIGRMEMEWSWMDGWMNRPSDILRKIKFPYQVLQKYKIWEYKNDPNNLYDKDGHDNFCIHRIHNLQATLIIKLLTLPPTTHKSIHPSINISSTNPPTRHYPINNSTHPLISSATHKTINPLDIEASTGSNLDKNIFLLNKFFHLKVLSSTLSIHLNISILIDKRVWLDVYEGYARYLYGAKYSLGSSCHPFTPSQYEKKIAFLVHLPLN